MVRLLVTVMWPGCELLGEADTISYRAEVGGGCCHGNRGGCWNTSEEAAVCERQRPGLQGCGEQAGDGEGELLYPGPCPFCGQSPAAPRGPLPPADSQAPSPGPSWVSNPSNSSSPSHPSRVTALPDAHAPEPALPLHLRPLPLGPSLPSRLILSSPPSKHPWSPRTQLHPSDHHPESPAALGRWGPLLTGLLAAASTPPPPPPPANPWHYSHSGLFSKVWSPDFLPFPGPSPCHLHPRFPASLTAPSPKFLRTRDLLKTSHSCMALP